MFFVEREARIARNKWHFKGNSVRNNDVVRRVFMPLQLIEGQRGIGLHHVFIQRQNSDAKIVFQTIDERLARAPTLGRKTLIFVQNDNLAHRFSTDTQDIFHVLQDSNHVFVEFAVVGRVVNDDVRVQQVPHHKRLGSLMVILPCVVKEKSQPFASCFSVFFADCITVLCVFSAICALFIKIIFDVSLCKGRIF